MESVRFPVTLLPSPVEVVRVHIWNPNSQFFRRGHTRFFSPLDFAEHKINWSLETVKTGLPISYTICSMKIGSQETYGFGDSFFLFNSTRQAFAEAWERFWMLQVVKIDKKITSSNGFAAGSNAAHASEKAVQELLDRAILIEAWQKKIGWNEYRSTSLVSSSILYILKSKGWRIRLFRISTESGESIIAALGTHLELGAIFDSALMNADNPNPTEIKVVRSLLKSELLQKSVKKMDSSSLPNEGKPMDHWSFYRDPKNLLAFDFLDQTESKQGLIKLSNIDKVKTTVIYDGPDLPAVAFAFNSEWRPLIWGLNSIGGQNKWPHPLA